MCQMPVWGLYLEIPECIVQGINGHTVYLQLRTYVCIIKSQVEESECV